MPMDATTMQAPAAWLWFGAWLLTLVAMEGWAALLHAQIWHRWLWPIHRSHHRGRGDVDARPFGAPAPGRWELNDLMPLLHAPVAMALLALGYCGRPGAGSTLLRGAGWGMSAFGVTYLLVHDGVAHGRFVPQWVLRLALQSGYLRRVRSAHCLHHRHGGSPFGLFTGPFVVTRQRQRRAQAAAARRRSAAPQRGCGDATAPARHAPEADALGHHAVDRQAAALALGPPHEA